MPWAEAFKILNVVFSTQAKTNPSLWEQFQIFSAVQKQELKAQRPSISSHRTLVVAGNKKSMAALKAKEKVARAALVQKFKDNPSRLQLEKTLLLKAQLDERENLKALHLQELDKFKFPSSVDYLEWLEAQEVNVEQQTEMTKALAKQIAKEKEAKEEYSDFTISVANLKNIKADIRDFTTKSSLHTGNVQIFNQRGQLAFIVALDKIQVTLNRDPEAVLAALKFASAKFGKLHLTGDAEFQQLCAQLAVKHDFKFDDDILNNQVEAIGQAAKPQKAPHPALPNPTQAQSAVEPEAISADDVDSAFDNAALDAEVRNHCDHAKIIAIKNNSVVVSL